MSSSSLRAGVLGGLIGAVVGGVVMLALQPAPVAAPQPTGPELRSAFAEALAPLLDELRSRRSPARAPTRPRVGATDEQPRADPEPSPTPPVLGGTRTMPPAAASEADAPIRPDSSVWTPPPNFERVHSVRALEEDIRVRQRWLFISERQALAEFGTPTSTWLSDNGECWVYEEPDVETEDEIIHGESTTLVFSRGRLVQVYD